MLSLTILLACADEPSPPPAAPPPATAPQPAPDVPEIEEVFVHASQLRLRPQPSGDTSTWSNLSINSRLRVLKRQGEWLQVTTFSGRGGWVHGEYVGENHLTQSGLSAQIEAATDPAERLSLYQRLAALSPGDPDVLAGLAAAYRAAGDAQQAARVDAVIAEKRSAFEAWFHPFDADTQAITAGLASAGSAAELIDLWGRALALTAALDEPLNNSMDLYEDGFDAGIAAKVRERLPWAFVTLYAEGTWAAIELGRGGMHEGEEERPDLWSDAAARTPEPDDDRLFALIQAAYGQGQFSPRGWASWQAREWDYGGCSPFGSGLHLALLTQTDALKTGPAAAHAAPIRDGVMADILQPSGPGEFPYCQHMGVLTPLESLTAEAEKILAEIALSDEERAGLQARLASKFEPRE